jgi:MFS family permease
MNLTGYVVLEHGHEHSAVFSVISAHFVGMFGLVLVVGRLIDRFGRTASIVTGLALVAASTVSLLWVESVWATGAAMFVLGLGWNFSYVAATAELVDLTAPSERGRLLGFSDMASAVCGAGLALGGGIAVGESGVAALSALATAVAVVPILLLAARRFRYNPAPAGT